ncbi:hypothetical protein CDL15_Pgr004457 [Punica granatum]|uniref:Uncharacterized protein n=1 Tax=Punica granatum TaxID=22663 RepID=A0A218XH14_PUNGR|nr:hypothetical protein CDL15_Pgr004457 [Punica granatum]PKI75776.1 hypothetical protein CRG98_003819 [Punica granatum]
MVFPNAHRTLYIHPAILNRILAVPQRDRNRGPQRYPVNAYSSLVLGSCQVHNEREPVDLDPAPPGRARALLIAEFDLLSLTTSRQISAIEPLNSHKILPHDPPKQANQFIV